MSTNKEIGFLVIELDFTVNRENLAKTWKSQCLPAYDITRYLLSQR